MKQPQGNKGVTEQLSFEDTEGKSRLFLGTEEIQGKRSAVNLLENRVSRWDGTGCAWTFSSSMESHSSVREERNASYLGSGETIAAIRIMD